MTIDIKREWLSNTFASENQFQAAAVKIISQNFPQLRNLFFHPNNEYYIAKREGESEYEYEQRRMREGNNNIAMGVLPGCPDICILYKGIFYKLELKQPNGTLTKSQKNLHPIWDKDCPKIPVVICYTICNVVKACLKIVNDKLTINFPEGYKFAI